jgi:alpha-D-xyloside xylohydrolase
MLGPGLLAAPVLKYEAKTRVVNFPAGGWYNFWTGAYNAAAGNIEVEAPLEHVPLFVRPGSIIPTGEIVQSSATWQQNLTILVYAGRNGKFTLYDDDGVTFDCKRGVYAKVPIIYEDEKKTVTIGPTEGYWKAGKREFTIKL